MSDEMVFPSEETLTVEALRERERCLEIVLRFKMHGIDYTDPENRKYVNGVYDTLSGIRFGISRGVRFVPKLNKGHPDEQ